MSENGVWFVNDVNLVQINKLISGFHASVQLLIMNFVIMSKYLWIPDGAFIVYVQDRCMKN